MHLLNVFCECMHIYYCMEIIILTAEMLLTHGVENISRVVRHCNRKVASQVVTGIVTTENLCSEKEVMNLLILIMNKHMHRMKIQFI
jgi:hypothetical protein